METDEKIIALEEETKITVMSMPQKPNADGERKVKTAYRTTVPKSIREAMDLGPDDRLCWIMFRSGVVTVTKAYKPQDINPPRGMQ